MVKSRTYVRTYNPLWNQWRLKPSRYTWVVVVLPLISTLVKSLLTTLCSTSPRFVDSHTHRNKSEKLYTWGIDTNPTDSTFQSTHLYTDNWPIFQFYHCAADASKTHLSNPICCTQCIEWSVIVSALRDLVFREQRRQPNGPQGGHFESRQLLLRPPTLSRRTKWADAPAISSYRDRLLPAGTTVISDWSTVLHTALPCCEWKHYKLPL